MERVYDDRDHTLHLDNGLCCCPCPTCITADGTCQCPDCVCRS